MPVYHIKYQWVSVKKSNSIDGLVQERRNFLALTHRYIVLLPFIVAKSSVPDNSYDAFLHILQDHLTGNDVSKWNG